MKMRKETKIKYWIQYSIMTSTKHRILVIVIVGTESIGYVDLP